ncbi:MAG: hypothetical protein IPL64_04385 [Flavobacteriales bacterium]|nr:hypothetical protein [Flavobacteriales bacterium]
MSRSSSARYAHCMPCSALPKAPSTDLRLGLPKAPCWAARPGLLKVSDGYLVGGNAFGSLTRAGLMHADEAERATWNPSYDITGDGFGEGSISTMLALPDGSFIVAGATGAVLCPVPDAAGTMLSGRSGSRELQHRHRPAAAPDGNILFTGKRQATPTMRSYSRPAWTAP